MQLDGVIPVFCLEDSKNPKGLKDGSEGHRMAAADRAISAGSRLGWSHVAGVAGLGPVCDGDLVSLVDYLSYFDYIKWSLLAYCDSG